MSLARCLYWRGQYADARVALGPPPEEASPAIAVRHARLASCLAVGQRDLQAATSIIADAKQRHHAQGDAGVTAAIASAAAFVHLAVGDLDSLDRDVAESIAAARLAHEPLRALKARLLLAEAERRRGRIGGAQAQLHRLKRVALTLPPIARVRWDLLSALAGGADVRTHLRRVVASTGLGALALYVPPEHTLTSQSGVIPSAPMEAEVSDVVAILRACQTAEDEPAVLRDVCTRVRGQLHAAAVGFLTWRDGRSELVVGDGARLDSEIAGRAIEAGI